MVSYSRWYADLGSPQDDEFVVEITDDDGVNWERLETVTSTENSWTNVSFAIAEFVDQTAHVRLRFIAEDDPNNSLVEAGIDEFAIQIFDEGPRVSAFGSPEIGTPIAFAVTGTPGSYSAIYYSSGTAHIDLSFVDGTILIDPATAVLLLSGILPSEGVTRNVLTIPNDPGLVGSTVYFQGMVLDGGISVSNRTQVTFE